MHFSNSTQFKKHTPYVRQDIHTETIFRNFDATIYLTKQKPKPTSLILLCCCLSFYGYAPARSFTGLVFIAQCCLEECDRVCTPNTFGSSYVTENGWVTNAQTSQHIAFPGRRNIIWMCHKPSRTSYMLQKLSKCDRTPCKLRVNIQVASLTKADL